MKVLFIGEGESEVGSPPHEEEQGSGRARKRQPITTCTPGEAHPAGGVLPVLAAKIIPGIADGAVALRMREITRLSPIKKTGLEAKAKGAVLIARRRFGCDGLVIVSDRDAKNEPRLKQLEECKQLASSEGLSVACGLAVEAIEAWTLGAPEAIAAVLDVDVATVRKAYPGPHVETLLEGSGKQEHRPKSLLQRLAELGHRDGDARFQREVAEQTDVTALEQACPTGFGAFAASLREAFGKSGDDT